MDKNYEHELIEFVTNMKRLSMKEDLDQYIRLHEAGMISSKVKDIVIDASEEIIDKKNTDLSTYIHKTLNTVNTMDVDTTGLDTFFSNIYMSKTLNTVNITTPMRESENINKIRPEYISTLNQDFDKNCKDILQGKVTLIDMKKKLLSKAYIDRKKEMLVDADIKIDNIISLMDMKQPVVVNVNNVFIQNNVIPFIRSYTQSMKEIQELGIILKNFIDKNTVALQKSMQYFREVSKTNKISKDTNKILELYIYNFSKINIDIITYAVSMFLRKLSYLTYNIVSIGNLKNQLIAYFPEGDKILHENTELINMEDIDNSDLLQSILNDNMSVMKPYIDRLIGMKKMEISNIISSKYNYKLDYNEPLNLVNYPYDAYPYAESNKSIINIAKAIKMFKDLTYDETLIVDEIISQSGLSASFITTYTNIINDINDIEFYTSQLIGGDEQRKNQVILCIYNDMAHYYNNIRIITDNISKTYNMITDLKDSYRANDNNFDNSKYLQLQSFIETIEKNFKEYIVLLAKKFMTRLNDLYELATIEDTTDEITTVDEYQPYDYTTDTFREAYTELVSFEERYKYGIAIEMKREQAYREKGIRVFREAVTTDTVKDGDSTKPTATTDAQSSTDNKNSDDKNKNDESSTKKDEGWKETFMKWVKDLFEKFKGNRKILVEKNGDFLNNENLEKLRNVSMENLNITVAPYPFLTSNDIVKESNNMKNKYSTITTNTKMSKLIPDGTDEEDVAKTFMGLANAKLDNSVDILTYGEGGKEMKTYSGQDAKTKLDDMIKFCTEYTSKTDNLTKLFDDVVKVMEDKLPLIDDKDSKVKMSTVISAQKNIFSSYLTAMERKYLDYIAVMKKLV